MLVSPVFCLVASAALAASPSVEKAERLRLSEEMNSLARRENWIGVDRKYREMRKLKKTQPSFRDHNLGAQAAYNLGNIAGLDARLTKALSIKDDIKAKKWQQRIRASFFRVEITVHKKYEDSIDLKAKTMSFEPDKKNSIQWAQKRLKRKRQFKGMLPAGEYIIGTKQFTLSKDQKDMVSVTLVPPKGEPLVQYIGPRVDLGASFSQAGQAGEGGLNSIPFSGMGTRTGIGITVGLPKNLSLLVEVGYHNIMSSGETPKNDLQISFGYEETPTRYHSAFLWAAAGYSLKKLSVLVGPSFDFGRAQVQGLDLSTTSTSLASRPAAKYAPMEGDIRAVGASGGFGYALLPLGQKLNGGISTLFGTQYDSARWYSWGQVAFTISPKRK